MLQRLISYWVYGGVLAGILLLVLSPLLVRGWSTPLAATFLLLPAYMVHQYEEHDQDRFRLFFNETIGKGFDVLSPLVVFITNVPGVWGVIALSLYGAALFSLGWALLAVYLVLVNAVVHIVHAILYRRYNPGLFTALGLFLPLGVVTLVLIDRAGGGSIKSHSVGLVTAVAIHAAILIHVRRKLLAMQRKPISGSETRQTNPESWCSSHTQPMPLISVKTSAPANDGQTLLKELSQTLATLLGKPERYVMTLLDTDVPMTFAGDPAPSCYVEVKSIGALDGDRTHQVSSAVCALIEQHLQIPADRTYISFEDVPPRLWGWNGSTFG